MLKNRALAKKGLNLIVYLRNLVQPVESNHCGNLECGANAPTQPILHNWRLVKESNLHP